MELATEYTRRIGNRLAAGATAHAREDCVSIAAEADAEIARLRGECEHACGLVAKMHHAATGSHDGPRFGVVEDVAAVAAELERERMRLVACGVVALADTPESAAKAREMHPDYRSASCDDVARRVDECIALRKDAERFRWLAARMLAADFDYGNDGVQALVFEMPKGFHASADCGSTIDAAMAASAAVRAA